MSEKSVPCSECGNEEKITDMYVITARKVMERPTVVLCPPCMLLNGDKYTSDSTNSFTIEEPEWAKHDMVLTSEDFATIAESQNQPQELPDDL